MRQILLPGDLRGTGIFRLDQKTAHYLRDVRRMQSGAVFPVVDEKGNRFLATLRCLKSGEAEVLLEPKEAPQAEELEEPCLLALVQALPKGQKFDLIIRQAVELGTSLIVPLITRFCVARESSDEAEAKLERRKRIIREALQQSGSSILTEITAAVMPDRLEQVLSAHGFSQRESTRIVFHESAGGTLPSLHEILADSPGRVVVCIGPEGGFSSEDMEALGELGFVAYHASGPIMRTETAALFALSSIRTLMLERSTWKH